MLLPLPKAFAPFAALVASGARYEGPLLLTHYEVFNVTMLEVEPSGDVLMVEVKLGRQLLGVMLNVFTPTLVLNIISYSTNFHKDENFESIIGINLTSMLVLVSLFVYVGVAAAASLATELCR